MRLNSRCRSYCSAEHSARCAEGRADFVLRTGAATATRLLRRRSKRLGGLLDVFGDLSEHDGQCAALAPQPWQHGRSLKRARTQSHRQLDLRDPSAASNAPHKSVRIKWVWSMLGLPVCLLYKPTRTPSRRVCFRAKHERQNLASYVSGRRSPPPSDDDARLEDVCVHPG